MQETYDEGRFHELFVESQDLQSDAMKGAKTDLGSYVEAAKESHFESRKDRPSPLPRAGALALGAGIVGAGALAFAGSASAANVDIQALQTAAGIENLAVFTYGFALKQSFITGNATVKAFAEMTMKQHQDHANAFNGAITGLKGKKQTGLDPVYTPIVQKAAPSLKTAAEVVALAITLEDVAAETYTKNVSQVSTATLSGLFTSVAGVEAQHKAILLAVQALLKGNLVAEIAIPTDVTKLPAAAGSVGFPDAYYPTSKAAPVTEGVVK